ncbi:MAG: alpha/beta hydrolase [Cytophagales bacterium]|nr:MAG: alpha/beta hydrolase [Cytophagales bacterium]
MSNKAFYFSSTDGLRLYAQTWVGEEAPQACFFIVHGMGEHSGRYTHLVNFLVENHFQVFAFDLRGHGLSAGQKGHTPNYAQLLKDIETFIQQSHAQFETAHLPAFLYGHSMGGNQVLNYVLKKMPDYNTFKGIISSSAYLKLAFNPPPIKIALGKFVNSIYPKFSQSTNLDVKAISKDPAVVEAYTKDPLVHDKISASFFLSTSQAALFALEEAPRFSLPLLLYHGTADKLTSIEGSKEFASKAPKNLTTTQWFEGGFHELHNDSEKEQLFPLMLNWLKQQLNA